jgi:hypothetical protein
MFLRPRVKRVSDVQTIMKIRSPPDYQPNKDRSHPETTAKLQVDARVRS